MSIPACRRRGCELTANHSFPGQEHVAGNSKIPSIMFYDADGIMKAAGAEAESASMVALAEDEGWFRTELCVPHSLLLFHPLPQCTYSYPDPQLGSSYGCGRRP